MTRNEVIQRMINFRGFKTYLEIGSYRNENVKNLVIDRKVDMEKLKYEDYLDLINRNANGVIPVSEYVRRTR